MNEPTRLSSGSHGSVDTETIRFQGRHKNKQKIKHKREGHGFMTECCCDNSFARSSRFRNMLPPIKKTTLKLSALHSRVLGLLHALPDSNCKR